MVALLTGLLAGLVRIGWDVPLSIAPATTAHGPLMVAGFLGTLISLERAVALGAPLGYGAPALGALGALALVAGAPAAPILLTAASVGLVALSLIVARRQPALFTYVMSGGALAWLVGNARWLTGAEIPDTVSWWIAFPLLTIAGERLELSRLLPVPPRARTTFVAIVSLLVAGVLCGGLTSTLGAPLFGTALLALAVWLTRHDVARRTVRLRGLPRYTAICLLSGYVWLGVAGLLAVTLGPVVAGPAYDAVLHAIFVGFVFAMIFGHAPIIFPAVLGVAVPFTRAFYAPLAFLHGSLALRVVGDVIMNWPLRRWGGLGNTAAILLFLASVVRAVAHGQRAAQPIAPIVSPGTAMYNSPTPASEP
jgi:hypothetical protein